MFEADILIINVLLADNKYIISSLFKQLKLILKVQLFLQSL